MAPGSASSRLGLLGVERALLGAGWCGGEPSLRRRSRRSAAMRSSGLPAGDGGAETRRQTQAWRSSASAGEMGGDARPSSSPTASPHRPQIHRPPYRARTPAMYGAVHSSVKPQHSHATSSSSTSVTTTSFSMSSSAPILPQSSISENAHLEADRRRVLPLRSFPVVAVGASASSCFHPAPRSPHTLFLFFLHLSPPLGLPFPAAAIGREAAPFAASSAAPLPATSNHQVVDKRNISMDIMQTSDSSHHGIVENSPYRIPYDRHAEGGQLGASWYFNRKEIEENSLSRRDGIDLKKEAYLRKSYCTFLQDLGMRLKVPQVTIATAIVFCHRFFLRQSHAKNDRRTIATVCMFLAGKVEETPRPLKDVILISYEIIHKKDPAAVQRIKQKEVYEQQKELILIGERVVLVTLGFDLNVHHPYKPLVEAIKKFKVAQNALAQVAWNFVNDGLRTSLCLQFKPHHIAAGAIFLAAKFLKVKLPSDGEKVWWQEFDVTPRQLEEVSNQMLELYEQNRVAPPASQGNDTEGSSASVANQRAPGKVPGAADESTAHEHHQAPRQSSQHGFDHPQNNRVTHSEARDGAANNNEGPNVSSSMMDAMKKINKDKVKAALEKRRKSKGDVSRKVDVMDDDDLIERELEHGVELAAEDEKSKQERRQSWPHPSHREDHQNTNRDNTEEGELSMDSQEYRSPEHDNRKRKDAHEHRNYDRDERDLKRLRS